MLPTAVGSKKGRVAPPCIHVSRFPRFHYLISQHIRFAGSTISHLIGICRYRLALKQADDTLVELPLFHVGGIQQGCMKRFSVVFVHQQFHQLAFPGQFILLTHDLQEGDGVVEVELTEVEAWGGGFGGDRVEATQERVWLFLAKVSLAMLPTIYRGISRKNELGGKGKMAASGGTPPLRE